MADPLWAVPGRAVPVSEISLAVIVHDPHLKMVPQRRWGKEGMCHGKCCLWYYTGLCFMGWKQRRNSA